MIEFYLRLNDPLSPVYQIDPEAGTWAMAASRIGVVPELGGEMPDGGALFRDTEKFARVWPKSEEDGVITYTRDEPAAQAPAAP
jgi:hypothetical protein